MKEIKVTVNTWYVVEGAAGATVTNPLTERVIATVEDGKQTAFFATTPYVVASDDTVSVFKATFNSAPAKLRLLGLLGGGAQALPAGYLAAEFLESDGTQYITTNHIVNADFGVKCKFSQPSANNVIIIGSYRPYFVLPRYNSSQIVGGFGVGGVYRIYDVTFKGSVSTGSVNFKNSGYLTLDGYSEALNKNVDLSGTNALEMFNIDYYPNLRGEASIFNVIFSKGYSVIADFIPALDPQGVPCMFDKVSKQPFYNSGTGAFIVGMTLAQARRLAELPATGGSLTVSLPTGYDTDEGAMQAIGQAIANGWGIAVQEYTPEAETAATTFGMRRIWVRRIQDENGTYVSADGSRWQVDWCVAMYTPDGSEPDAHGYELFRSVDAATEYWGLEPWVAPEAEEILTEPTTNE